MQYSQLREQMVELQIRARGVHDPGVLEAMSKVPREEFVPAVFKRFAYEDRPLPIGGGQTISQPFIVAFMAEALQLTGEEKVLEIGTGSGYSAAILAEIADQVYTVERVGKLADKAKQTLARLGYTNVHVLVGDGTKGWVEHAPYDAIVVTAGGPHIPQPLQEQLGNGGKLVIPVGPTESIQRLCRINRVSETDYEEECLCEVRFVPLIGEEGWESEVL